MIRAPIAKNEFERLSALLDYKILDSEPELDYDAITQLASTICQAPIAMISLLDENRQWFKSKVGFAPSETPRDISFCGHAIQISDIFVVKDATKDERFFDNPAVTGASHFRFYVAAPLITPTGHAVGTLCVVDSKVRELTSDQINALKLLSKQVVALLELRKSHRLLNENYETLRVLSKKVRDQEQMLIHSTKLSALGEMAAGVAHEINNPLTIISGRTDQIIAELRKNPISTEKIEKYSQAITDTVTRIAKVVRGLKSFSGNPEQSELRTIHIGKIADTIVTLSAERAKIAGVELHLDIHDDSLITCSILQISQIFLNLINNSFDAVKGLTEKWIRISISRKQNTVLVNFVDSGKGIPETIREKIMEPFFSTKTVGKGVGLGLSVSQGLADNNGGFIHYDSECPNTCFVLNLPIAKEIA